MKSAFVLLLLSANLVLGVVIKRQNSPIQIITQCTAPNTVAVTYDDGPTVYTSRIIDAFDAAGGKVTFFVNGLNYDCIYNHAETVRRAYASGHQIASHTWGHADLATLPDAAVAKQMTKLDAALRNIIGAVPTYMRPPYGSHTPATSTVLQSLGYTHLVMWDLDSGDSAGLTPEAQQAVYNNAATDVSHNVLHHDTSESVASIMTPFVINWAKGRNLRMVTVGECLGDPVENWYRDRAPPATLDSTFTCA